jgi:hypothetical protein
MLLLACLQGLLLPTRLQLSACLKVPLKLLCTA